LQAKRYLLTVDRFSNWPDLREATTAHTPNAGTDGLIKSYRELFATFGVPEHLSSDGGPEYTSKAFQAFMKTWGIKHRLASAYHPQSNGRAEVTVKAMKRLLRDNIDSNGKLDTDAVMRGILQIRNTPETDSGLSPAQILLGRTLRDTLPLRPPIPHGITVFDQDSAVSPVWKDAWATKEHALKTRLARQVEKLEVGSHALKPLDIGDTVRIQNQTGNHPTKWDKTGSVVQVGDNDQYLVRVDGSRRLTLRNRRYLRKMICPSHLKKHLQPAPSMMQLPAAPVWQHPTTEAEKPQLQPPQAMLPVHNVLDEGHSSRPLPLNLPVALPAPVTPDAGPASPPATPNQRVTPPARATPDATLPCRPTTGMPSMSQEPCASVPAMTPTVQLRRSTRDRKQRVCYDPSTGGYTYPNAIGEDI